MRKYWYIYKNNRNVGMTGSKYIAFHMLETHAGRPWSKENGDTSEPERITLGSECVAKLEQLK